VISESQYWKEDLLRIARRLKSRAKKASLDELLIIKNEKDIFFGFYIIRKLTESKKLTDASSNILIAATKYLSIGEPVDHISRYGWDELYDFDFPNDEQLKLSTVYNQIIHSHIFAQIFDDENENLVGIFVTSDKTSNKLIYYLRIQDIVDVFQKIGHDIVTSQYVERDPITHKIVKMEVK
jgi:hypothetical protein